MRERIAQLEKWMKVGEDEHFEFKEAKNQFDSEKLTKYCAALANELGGKLFLGITDTRPRKAVGTVAFRDLNRVKALLIDRIHLRVDVEEIEHPNGRVLVFDVPSRPIGMPIQYDGRYFMRSGDRLVHMTSDRLKTIIDEAGPDYSAEICTKAILTDLDSKAINDFRHRWIKKSNNGDLQRLSDKQLLIDAELITDDGITNAALILLGTKSALGKHLAQSEVIFEYRSSDVTGPAQQRVEFRNGFLSIHDDLWKLINTRNDLQHYQDGLFIYDIPTFNESAIREALLNAVCHRDYRMGDSVFIRQYPRRFEIISPGGFPPGINEENILNKQSPRNRRIAEALSKCGLVERAGQGMNSIYEACIKESKPMPDFSNTDEHHVWLTLRGEIDHPEFISFLEKVGQEQLASFSTEDFLVVNYVFRGLKIPERHKENLFRLMEKGVIERINWGRGTRYILSRQFYKYMKKSGTYTRKRGLDRDTNKALLFKHIEDNSSSGSKMNELLQVLPGHSRSQVQVLLRELKAEGKIHVVGNTRGAKWYSSM